MNPVSVSYDGEISIIKISNMNKWFGDCLLYTSDAADE